MCGLKSTGQMNGYSRPILRSSCMRRCPGSGLPSGPRRCALLGLLGGHRSVVFHAWPMLAPMSVRCRTRHPTTADAVTRISVVISPVMELETRPIGTPGALDTLGRMTDGQPNLSDSRTFWRVIIAIVAILVLIGALGDERRRLTLLSARSAPGRDALAHERGLERGADAGDVDRVLRLTRARPRRACGPRRPGPRRSRRSARRGRP